MTEAKSFIVPTYHAQRCASCHQRVALSTDRYTLRTKLYCSKICTAELPAVEESVRNDEWEILVLRGHLTPVGVGKAYGSPHGQVYKTLNRLSQEISPVQAQYEVLARIPKASDLQMHVRRATIDGETILEFRDYVPSLDAYRRGNWMPLAPDTVSALLSALTLAAEQVEHEPRQPRNS